MIIGAMKTSKYNFITYDHNGNMIIYNFLTGMKSLAKVMKQDVDKFKYLFLKNADVLGLSCEKKSKVIETMLEQGILIPNDVDESILYDDIHYRTAYDNKLNLTILPTGKCMFKCPYCYEESQDFCKKTMTIDNRNTLIRFVQKNISKYKSLKVNWYGGEPLLQSDTIEYLSNKFIQICNMWHLPYAAEMTTNGYLLNADMFDKLYRLRVYTYMITLDGFRDQHNQVKFTNDGKGSYDVILNNLLRIRDNKQYKFAHIIVRVNVSRDTFNRIDEFVSYVSSLFSDDKRFEITFAAVVPYTENTLYDKFVNPFELHEHLFKNEIYMNKIYDEKLKIGQLIPEQKCLAALKNAYVIAPDLSVYKCYSYFENTANKVGNINSKGDLIINETAHKRWYLVNKYVQEIPKRCNDCYYLPCCRYISPGCPIRYYRKQSWQSCVLQNKDFEKDLAATILYAAQHYPVTHLVLQDNSYLHCSL